MPYSSIEIFKNRHSRLIIAGTVLITALTGMYALNVPQKKFHVSGKILFKYDAYISSTRFKTVNGKSESVKGYFDTASKNIEITVPAESFRSGNYERDERMHEKMESELHKNIHFAGKITGLDPSTGSVEAQGKLTFHNVSRDIKLTGILSRQRDSFKLVSLFSILLTDYSIKVPADFAITSIDNEIKLKAVLTLNQEKLKCESGC